MKNILARNNVFISKILYALSLCLASLVLSAQVSASAASDEYDVKRIALTFDDGPHPVYTNLLLDGLKERGVKATFFVIGQNAELYPDIVKRMSDDGHLIGNHTYSHIQLTSSNRSEFKQELVKTNEILQSITGAKAQYVRPPYGEWDKSLESELNMFPVLWSIDPRDWCTLDSARVTNSVINNAGDNGIILLHDCYQSSVDAALMIVDELQKDGYEFVTVDELLFD